MATIGSAPGFPYMRRHGERLHSRNREHVSDFDGCSGIRARLSGGLSACAGRVTGNIQADKIRPGHRAAGQGEFIKPFAREHFFLKTRHRGNTVRCNTERHRQRRRYTGRTQIGLETASSPSV